MSPITEALPLTLDELVECADADLREVSGNALLHVSDGPIKVTSTPIEDHPLDDLLGLSAPDSWLAIGVHSRAKAHFQAEFDLEHGYHQVRRSPIDPTRVIFTTLVDRRGRGAALLREGENLTRLDGPPEGMVGDACKRALGLPTAPPPRSTAELWLRLWLDQLIEVATFRDDGFGLDWADVAELHPAWTGAYAAGADAPLEPGDDPQTLVDATITLADQWSWSKLRADPERLDGANGPVPPWIAQWMDDGMFARSALTDVGPLVYQLTTIHHLLQQHVLDNIAEVILSTGLASL